MTHTFSSREPGAATLAIHAGEPHAPASGLVVPGLDPVEAGSVLEERLAILEGGTAAVAAASGVSAHLLVLHMLLDPGDSVMVSSAVFGAAFPRVARAADEFGWTLIPFDAQDLKAIADGLQPAVKGIVVESMTATGGVVDLPTVAAMANRAGIPLLVDNTAATPALVRPVQQGAHVVIHSGATALAGREDIRAGFVVDGGTFDWTRAGKLARPLAALGGQFVSERFGNFALAAALRLTTLRDLGAGLDPASEAAILAGLSTLDMRMRQQAESALAVAHHLAAHPGIAAVDYAGLGDADRETGGPAGPGLSFRLHTTNDQAQSRLTRALQLFSPAGRFGSPRSAILTFPGTDPGTVALSIGLETPADLMADLDQALAGLA